MNTNGGATPKQDTFGCSDPGFRPLPAFPALDRVYEQDFLFPFFEHRAIDPDRPDYDEYVSALGLDRSATPLDILARSGGRRAGDKIQMQVEPPIAESGATTCTFLVRGLRFVSDRPASTDALGRLETGDPLGLVPESDNPVNRDALLVTTVDGLVLGWVPELLVEYATVARNQDARLSVVQRNSANLPAHLRLLVRLDGYVPPSYRPFVSEEWRPFAEASTVC